MTRAFALTSVLSAVAVWANAQIGQRCLPCHPQEVTRFRASPMGNSVSKRFELPDGAFEHPASGSRIRIYSSDGELHHELTERGLTADYPIAYAIGAGKVGQSFLVAVHNHLFQSPASYYTAREQWDVSPGYEKEKILDFNRSITSDCLFCHSNSGVKPGVVNELEPISCERCHGSAEAHLRNPVPGSIVNPAKLAGRQRDSVCEQCHLEGATAVLNPGKYWWDFKPGEPLESVEAHYVYRSNSGMAPALAAVSQAEQLVLSRCYRESSGRLWCGSCHDPHGDPAAHEKQVKQTCLGCHQSAQLSTTHNASQQDCTGCHMPKRAATDIAHAAITDHLIAAHPSQTKASFPARELTVWHEPAPSIVERDFGLANFYVAKRDGSSREFQTAFRLLASAHDDEAEAASGYILLAAGKTEAAIACFKAALSKLNNSEYWLDLGVAQQANGNLAEATTAFQRSIALAPWDYRPYEALVRLYDGAGQLQEARQTRESFIRLVPQSILMRLGQNR